jgi:hypothetical protein
MHLEHNPTKIIVYSLSFAFICKIMIVPFLKQLYLTRLEQAHDELKMKIVKDEYWADNVSAINSEWNERRKRIVTKQYKPFECIKCMTFWSSMIIAICIGYQGEAAFVGIVGLAAGMLLEGILMRYF